MIHKILMPDFAAARLAAAFINLLQKQIAHATTRNVAEPSKSRIGELSATMQKINCGIQNRRMNNCAVKCPVRQHENVRRKWRNQRRKLPDARKIQILLKSQLVLFPPKTCSSGVVEVGRRRRQNRPCLLNNISKSISEHARGKVCQFHQRAASSYHQWRNGKRSRNKAFPLASRRQCKRECQRELHEYRVNLDVKPYFSTILHLI